MDFRWNDCNVEHVDKHGVTPDEAEMVVSGAKRPFPRKIGEDKWLAWGRGQGGRFLQVVFVLDDDGAVYIIHARPLTTSEKRRFRRRRKS